MTHSIFICSKNVPNYGASKEVQDLGYLTFDLQTDLSGLLNWNVKQLFLYLTAEYKTEANELNQVLQPAFSCDVVFFNLYVSFQVVLWDKIILRGENAVLDFKNMNTKYYFWDDGNGLRGHKNVTLTLSWNIIPNAGLLPTLFGLGEHSFKFPDQYTMQPI